ncbi:MAG TPA: hypothetical protein VL179_08715, partial [Mycobacterium sp.]|nr:hypothetical protein [Mycobacterium sp.]
YVAETDLELPGDLRRQLETSLACSMAGQSKAGPEVHGTQIAGFACDPATLVAATSNLLKLCRASVQPA